MTGSTETATTALAGKSLASPHQSPRSGPSNSHFPFFPAIRLGAPAVLIALAACTDYSGAFSSGLSKSEREALLQETRTGSGHWQDTDRPKCQTWNPDPAPDAQATWSGACVAGKASGPGQLLWTYQTASGATETAIFDGDLRDGYGEGHGTYRIDGGFTYEGDFKQSRIEGPGVMRYPNGDRYEGDWSRGKLSGIGKITLATGETFDGHFYQGQKWGHGISTSPDGSSYEGGFSDGKRNGIGTCHEAATGRTGPCEYREGSLVRWL